MSLHEPNLRHRADYVQRLLARLQREAFDRGRTAHPFSRLCDMASIPHDLRAALLQRLVLHGHVQPEGGDLISLTAAGLQLASTPPVAASDNASPRDGESLARPPGGGTRT